MSQSFSQFTECIFICFRVLLADGAYPISNALTEVFGDGIIRLMCWTHCCAAFRKKLRQLVKNKEIRKKIETDILEAQWQIQSFEEFPVVLNLIKSKHEGEVRESATDSEAVRAFWEYFFEQWGPDSHTARCLIISSINSYKIVSQMWGGDQTRWTDHIISHIRWFEAAHPWHISNNQGHGHEYKKIFLLSLPYTSEFLCQFVSCFMCFSNHKHYYRNRISQ